MQRFSLSVLKSALLLLFYFQTSPAWARVDTLRAFPEKRFVNGLMDFGQHIAKNLRYPLEAMQTATVGTELVSFIIAPTGKLANIAIVNSLGKAIDWEVVRAIRTTDKMWMTADPADPTDSVMLFLPVRFTLESRSGKNDFHVEAVKPDFIQNEIVVIGYSGINFDVRDDAYYISELSAALPKQDYKRMLKMVNELIRRNPYSDRLYLQRAKIEEQLGQTDEACRDYKKIIYFLGRTRFPRQFLQNCSGLSAQSSSEIQSAQTLQSSSTEEEIFTVCEIPPSFPGGMSRLNDYIHKNLRYPENAVKAKVEGRVLVSFIVRQDGSIQDVSVLKGYGYGTDEEALRLIQTMPNWIPGKQSGRPVNVKYNMVVPFALYDIK